MVMMMADQFNVSFIPAQSSDFLTFRLLLERTSASWSTL